MSDRNSIPDDMSDDPADQPSQSRWGKSTYRSRASIYTQAKTGGEVMLEVEERHRAKRSDEYIRDEFNSFDFEMKQLDPSSLQKENIHKYVESLVTGNFYKVSKGFQLDDLAPQEGYDADGDGIVSTTEKIDFAMKESQKVWVNILNNGFNFTLGLLSGLSLLEVFFLAFTSEMKVFIASYTNFANITCIITTVLTNLAFIFGLALSMIYNQKAQKLTISKNVNRLEYQKLYNFTIVSTFMVMIAWMTLQALPKYANQITYLQAGEMKQEDYETFRALSFVKDAALIVTWTIVSFNNKSSISDSELDPEDNDDDQDADGPMDDDQFNEEDYN